MIKASTLLGTVGRLLAGAVLVFSAFAAVTQTAPYVKVTGTLQGPNGLPAPNNLLTFKPTQIFFIPGTNTAQNVDNLYGSGAPAGTCLISGQFYTNTATTPQTVYQCQFGVWVQVTAGTGLVLQHNGVNLADQVLLNFNDTTPAAPPGSQNCTFQSLSNGSLSCYVSLNLSGALTMAVTAPISGQYVIVHPTSTTVTFPSGAGSVTNNTSGLLNWYCTGVLCNLAPNTVGTWSGFALPAGVSAGSVTAIYAYSVSSSYSSVTPIASTFVCGPGSTVVQPGTITWPLQQTTGLTGVAGSAIGTITCTATLVAGGAPGPSGKTINIADIGLIVFYTGAPVTSPAVTFVAPPLYYNPALQTLAYSLTVAPFNTLPACAAGTEGQTFPINDSTTATWGATITGGSTNHVLAYCDGTNWTVAAK